VEIGIIISAPAVSVDPGAAMKTISS